MVSSIVEGIAAGLLHVSKASAMDVYFDNDASIVLGIAFLLVALLCRYGAELGEKS